MIALMMLLSVFIILSLGFLLVGNYFYGIIINWPSTNSYAVGYEGEAAEGAFNVERYNSLDKESVRVDSRYGYQLQGLFIKNAVATKNTVILVHGIGQDKWNSLKYGDVFLDLGYNIFIYDNRGHGETDGAATSYGYYEQDDLQSVVATIKSKNPGGIIGIHGESLGASTAMMYSEMVGNEKDISFLVEDCGYSDLTELYIGKSSAYNVPTVLRPALVKALSLICKIRSGFFLEDVSPIKNIDNLIVPTLFIHGDRDIENPTQMVYDLYDKKKTGIKALYIAPGARHAESLKVDKAGYEEVVANFLDLVSNSRSGN